MTYTAAIQSKIVKKSWTKPLKKDEKPPIRITINTM